MWVGENHGPAQMLIMFSNKHPNSWRHGALHGCASHLKKWRTSHMCIVSTDNVYNRLFLRDWIVGTATDCSICFFKHTSSGMHIQVPKASKKGALILRLLQKETHSNHSGAHLSRRDQRQGVGRPRGKFCVI